jgi:peptidylprolyl isomerase
MKKSKLLLLSSFILLALSCTDNKTADGQENKSNVITTTSGLQYEIITKTDGKQAKAGDFVKVHYTGTFTDGKKFDSSLDRGEPLGFKLGAGRVIKGWDEGIALLKVGEKAKLTIPGNLAYGPNGIPGAIPPDATLIFEVELVDASEPPVAKPFDVTGLKKLSTKSGLSYYMVKSTEGASPVSGKGVAVHYTGYLDDGTKFDSSVERDQPFQFVLGAGQVIKGWDEGIALLKVGEKARFIIPSSLGYGESGYPPVIPQNATLTFDVELVAIQ